MIKFGYINEIKDNTRRTKIQKNKKVKKSSLHSPPKKIKNEQNNNKKKDNLIDTTYINAFNGSKRELIKKINSFEINNNKQKNTNLKINNKENIINNYNIRINNNIIIKKNKRKKKKFIHNNSNKKNNLNILSTKGIEKNDNENNNFNLININLKNKKHFTPKNSNYILNNYTFDEAIKYDLRGVIVIFYIFLLSKQEAFHAFLYKSPLEVFQLRFCLFIFIFSSDLALNAFFYLDDKISKKYKYAQSLFLFTFNNNMTIIFLSTFIGFILMTFFTNLSNSSNTIRDVFLKEEEKIKIDKEYIVTANKKKEIYEKIENILKKYKIKIIILIIIESLLMIFFWYYVTAFCHIYSSTQISWLLDSLLTILSRIFIQVLISFAFAKLYRMAVESNIKCLYKVVIFFYCFA